MHLKYSTGQGERLHNSGLMFSWPASGSFLSSSIFDAHHKHFEDHILVRPLYKGFAFCVTSPNPAASDSQRDKMDQGIRNPAAKDMEFDAPRTTTPSTTGGGSPVSRNKKTLRGYPEVLPPNYLLDPTVSLGYPRGKYAASAVEEIPEHKSFPARSHSVLRQAYLASDLETGSHKDTPLHRAISNSVRRAALLKTHSALPPLPSFLTIDVRSLLVKSKIVYGTAVHDWAYPEPPMGIPETQKSPISGLPDVKSKNKNLSPPGFSFSRIPQPFRSPQPSRKYTIPEEKSRRGNSIRTVKFPGFRLPISRFRSPNKARSVTAMDVHAENFPLQDYPKQDRRNIVGATGGNLYFSSPNKQNPRTSHRHVDSETPGAKIPSCSGLPLGWTREHDRFIAYLSTHAPLDRHGRPEKALGEFHTNTQMANLVRLKFDKFRHGPKIQEYAIEKRLDILELLDNNYFSMEYGAYRFEEWGKDI